MTARRIDAHHHLWNLDVRDQPWTHGLPVLRRSYAFNDLEPGLDAMNIDATVLVQTIPVESGTKVGRVSLTLHFPSTSTVS